MESKLVKTAARVRVFQVHLPSPVETNVERNNTVHGSYFQPATLGPHPACVLLHGVTGEFLLMRTIAMDLAERGIAVFTIQLPYYGERRDPDSPTRLITFSPQQTAEHVTQAVLDTRVVAAWLASRPEVDAKRLTVAGLSLGGIIATLSAEAEPRFAKLAVFMGGGELAATLWNHRHRQVKRFRQKWLQAGGNETTLAEVLRPVEPTEYGDLLNDRPILLIAAKHDTVFSRESTQSLKFALGKQAQLVWLNAGHVSSVLFLKRETRRLGEFILNDDISDSPQKVRR